MNALIPLSAFYFAVILDPLIQLLAPVRAATTVVEAGVINRVFWPIIALVALVQTARNLRIAGMPKVPPHVVCLLLCVAFAGLSVLWAYKPGVALTRYLQQCLVLATVALPALTAPKPPDLIRGVTICLLISVVLNIGFVIGTPPVKLSTGESFVGYFENKNYLGELAAIACLVGWYGVRRAGRRRAIGFATLSLALVLLFMANSKTAIALVGLTPLLAWVLATTWQRARISPAAVLALMIAIYMVAAFLTGLTTGRLGYIIYGDPTFTGRTLIWDFVVSKADERPWLGWGYQSFWLVGADSPAITQAPGWVKTMPNGHNGYYDTRLELGYIGLALLLAFIFATLHGARNVVSQDPKRGRLLLSLLLMVFCYNFLESLWLRGYEFKWVLFLVVAVDIARYAPGLGHRPSRRM